MTREELAQAVSQAVLGYLARGLGFPSEVSLDPIHTVYANFLFIRFYQAASLVLDEIQPHRHQFFFALLGKGMAFAAEVERLPWTEASFLLRSLSSAGVPGALPSYPKDAASDALGSAEAFARFWEEYGHLVILEAVLRGTPEAVALVEKPPYVLLPTGWISASEASSELESYLHRPGRRPKRAIRLALDAFKVAPPNPGLVNVAFSFLKRLRSIEIEP